MWRAGAHHIGRVILQSCKTGLRLSTTMHFVTDYHNFCKKGGQKETYIDSTPHLFYEETKDMFSRRLRCFRVIVLLLVSRVVKLFFLLLMWLANFFGFRCDLLFGWIFCRCTFTNDDEDWRVLLEFCSRHCSNHCNSSLFTTLRTQSPVSRTQMENDATTTFVFIVENDIHYTKLRRLVADVLWFYLSVCSLGRGYGNLFVKDSCPFPTLTSKANAPTFTLFTSIRDWTRQARSNCRVGSPVVHFTRLSKRTGAQYFRSRQCIFVEWITLNIRMFPLEGVCLPVPRKKAIKFHHLYKIRVRVH